ncbi:MAG: chemotaxis-specific protein-glutamate methyltransferase CheB [Methanolinea sp.]|jgi:two-component system chemotaxis response regulator CheB|nr:chemotaxis-specific protein-glutamate methyltransferase CheB [Methanolinea sp.]
MIRVLIVDDSLFMRTMIRDMLAKDPEIEVVATAADGVDALKKIGECAPDVVTLDVEMPRMNGLDVLKNRSQFRTFPKVMMLSSLTSEGAEMTRKAMLLGADDFMPKPKEMHAIRNIERELLEKIHNLVNIAYIERPERRKTTLADRVVVVGASAGGPPMLDILLSSFKTGIPAAMVVTQHMPEGGFTASLATRLNRISPMPVKETENGDVLNQGSVYISRAGYHSVISALLTEDGEKGGRIVHSQSPPLHSVRPAVDKTFTSASSVFGERVVSVILSGMGNDGGDGMAVVKEHGGRTLVCREEDCLVYGMARSALTRNCVEQVLPLAKIGREIAHLVEGMAN